MAVGEEVRKKYMPTIGIETHVQLKTKTKLFSAVGNDARQAAPNSLISHIDAGMPGALPVLNKAAIELACRAAFALNTKPQKFSKFDRKHYFYPDLPKGYQITQFEDPIIKGGYVEFNVDGQPKKVEITRVHLEEDAGKNIHPTGADYSLVDLNRAGTPLLEIVSEPQIHSAPEAKAYARELYLLMKYADVSDVDLYHGNLRFDVNISVSQNPDKPGKRAEIKNLNSFRSVENAVEYEIERQIELYEKGQQVVQETRGWDEAKQKTTSQRGKEEAQDYRYMPEPDIPPLELDDEFIEKIKSEMPRLPSEWRHILGASSVSPNVTETLLDYPALLERLESVQKIDPTPETIKRVGDWFVNVILSEELKRHPNIDLTGSLKSTETVLYPEGLATLSNMVDSNELSSTSAKSLLVAYWTELINIAEKVKQMGLAQMSDESEIEKIIAEVLVQNPQAAKDVLNGEMKAIGFLVGQVMAKSQGKANPQLAQSIIKKQLGVE
jgi:aspartyl-tRNA(Asn)/glutamyl-tRNA(Gln) amidotransferase subunit B